MLTFILIANSCVSLVFGLFVFFKNRGNRVYRLYLVFSLLFSLWSLGEGMMLVSRSEGQALFWARLLFFAATFIPVVHCQAWLAFVGREQQNLSALKTGYALALFFAPFVLFGNHLIGGVRPILDFNYYTAAGPLMLPFFLFFSSVVNFTIYQLILAYRTAPRTAKPMILSVALSWAIGYGGGSTAFLPTFGFGIYPYGIYFMPLFYVVTSYAVIRYRFMDISVVFNRGLTYAFLIVLTILPLALALALSPRVSVHSMPPLLAGALIFACGLWILLKNPRSATNITFSLFSLGVCIWLFGLFRVYSTTDAREALFWVKFVYVGVAFIPAFFYHFCVSFLQHKENKKILLANYIISAFFLASLPTDYFVNGLYSYFWGYHAKAGYLHPLFLVYFFLVSGLSLQRLYRGYKAKEGVLPREAIRIKYVFWAFVIGYTASIDYIQVYGVEVYPTGFIFVTLWTLIVTYAIAKYQVMGLSLIITRAKLIPYLQVSALIPLYALILFIGYLVDGSAHYVSSGVGLAVFILTAGLVQKAKEQAEQMVQRMMFRKSYESSQIVQNLNEAIATMLDPKELTCKIIGTLSSAIGVSHATLYLQDDKGDYRLAAAASPRPNQKEVLHTETDRLFFSWLERQEKVIELEEMEHEGREKEILPRARAYFSQIEAKLSLPLVHQKKLIGMINLGEKKGDAPYTHSDIALLSSLRAQASISLSNALVYHGVRQISQGLEHEVAQRTHELAESKKEVEAAYRKLQELDQIKSQFFANISHEVRTPLTLILAPLQSLLPHPALPEEMRRQLDVMYQNGLRLLRLMNNLLDFAKIDAGKMTMAYRRLDFIPFIKGIVSSVAPLAEKKEIQLLFSGEKEPVPFYFDPDKIEKVLLNLILNALKFTPSGGRVEISCLRKEETVQVTVSDTGIGVANEDLPKLFSRFSQVDASASRQYEGTGLGLALAKDFVALHKGKIWAESQPGRGTTMSLALPLREAPPEGTKEKKDHAEEGEVDWTRSLQRSAEYSSSGILKEPSTRTARVDLASGGATVLLVEDNPDMLQLLASQLQGRYRILTASDGVQGLEAARAQRPALIISDVMMPRMDGYQLCRELKGDPATRQIPVILLTAKADLSMKIEGLECGADEYLTKPFSSEELHARIQSLLTLKETESQLIQSEKMATLGLLVAGMSHEINNPLNFSTQALSVLRRSVAKREGLMRQGVSPERDEMKKLERWIEEAFDTIREGQGRIERIVQDLKTYVRKGENVFTQTDLHAGLDATLRLIQVEMIGKIDVIKEYGEIGFVDAVPGQINQVFMNFLQNAIHAIPPDRNGEIRIKSCREEDWVKISIRDNGMGIPRANLARIFDPFFTTKAPGKGTGLGLSVCDRIVKGHGGRIDVQSEPGVGTEMTITLPARQVSVGETNNRG